jgi:uncharacterized membrane protein
MIDKRKRVHAIDIARGFAIVFMIFVNVLETYATPEVLHSTFGRIIEFFGSPATAPVFMAAMGVSFYYSRNTDLQSGIHRGIKIILLGYFLNIVRSVIPVIFVKTSVPAQYASLSPAITNLRDGLADLDILQFAGLSLIVMAFIRRLKINKYVLLLTAVVIAIVSPELWGLKSGNASVDFFLDYLWGDTPSPEPSIGNLVAFPFFPWFTFVLAGMFLGDTLTKSNDPTHILKVSGLIGGAIAVVSLIFMQVNLNYYINDYAHSRPWNVVFIVGFIMFWFYLCNVFYERIKTSGVVSILIYWSRNVNSIYMIHWILIMPSAIVFLNFNQYSVATTCIIMVSTTILTHFLNVLYEVLQTRLPAAKLAR